MVQAVVDKVRDQLQNSTRRSVLLAHGGAGRNETGDETLYLVKDKDIVDFLSVAFAELEHAEDVTPMKRISARGCKALSSSPSLPKLNSRCNIITPCLAAAADPATTISVPKTSFSGSGGADIPGCAGTRCPDASTRATVVSRRSATEIVWRENEADSRLFATKRASGTDPGIACKNHSSPLGELSPVNSLVRDGSADRRVNMTSFPELQPRHCTNEWLKPPVEMDQLTKACPPDFYRMGVDAHGGGGAPNESPNGLSQEPVVNALYGDRSLFSENPFNGDGDGWPMEHRETRRPSSMTADKRLGTWIGSASHRRRSTQAADSKSWQDEPANNNNSLLPSFLDRLRWNGQSIFHRHDDCPAPPTPPPTTPGSPSAMAYEVGTGGDGGAPRRPRCDTCSEDNRPHVCKDDLDSESVGVASSG
ncbi:uncharacterized protein HRG_07652 [Hirsutella rhossiliensis]|uniref:Uncharacterized protein n=1 Tax=Hirsutella rhossiliensis TaxID=111463 RepID=A0A9P8MWB6_9HYPO|nr:uncharacterized protein HRG_07652 [Hirsutella rhossiliensis]KAH0961574.1 hypothetical protein HRG_07652 [Hirsutella rhossiliensis]